MSAIAEASLPVSINRRRRVRQKVHAPAYASFGGASNSGASNSGMIDLYEVLDISEVGVALQCSSPMKTGQQLELSLDLAEARGPIYTSARVVWSDEAGRVGLSLPTLGNSALHRLQEWLFLNAMASAANAASSGALPSVSPSEVPRPNYTDTLTAASAVQREAESQGSDLEAVLSLIASRSQSLLRASGAAIALAAKDPGTMICRASAGPGAPPVGATLQVGSGFSGECVRSGKILRCDDTETDERVDSKSCRALGIRSMLAAPLRLGERVVGLLEVFSEQPSAFGENDTGVLQRFAETIVAAVNRAVRVHQPAPDPVSPKYSAPPGSILFAREPELNSEKKDGSPKDDLIKDGSIKDDSADADEVGGIRLPRAHLYFLVVVAAIIFLVLGYTLAPWIQEKLQSREQNGVQTVLASTQAPQATVTPPTPAIETATLDQLRQFAAIGEPAAEYLLGTRYASGDGIKQDDKEADSWFLKAAENGNVKAQATLGTRYWGGRGVPASLTQAYFWTVLARAAGDQNSKTFAEILASRMTHAQAVAIEQKAEIWYEQHEPTAKPAPGR
jgi:putative methionine-R-sulfoxide reductase with GAF domain